MVLAIFVVLGALFHGVPLILMVAAWWAADVVMRVVVMACNRYPSKATLTKIGDDVVRIQFPKIPSFEYNAGQFVQISIPDINVLAFHPFSIASAPHEPMVTLYARALGDWTQKLLMLAERKEEVAILVEGPYGSISLDMDNSRYQMCVCVSGGIGVTHCQSIAKALLNHHQDGRQIKHLKFVWSIRDVSMLEVMAPLESYGNDIEISTLREAFSEEFDLSASQKLQPSKLIDTQIFVTKKSNSPTSEILQKDPRTIQFGRPDLNAIIRDVKLEAERRRVTHVAVFGCGPKQMLDKMQEACRAHSRGLFDCSGVTFDVHEEMFEF